MNAMYWSVRRELWENRSIYLAPAVVAALAFLGFVVSVVAGIWRMAPRLDAAQQAAKLAEPYTHVSLLIMGTTFVVAVFYSLDALHGERRDRSVLFWKSLPVSDVTTVLSKAFVPIVIVPLLTFAVTVVTQLLMLLASSAFLLASGENAAALWEKLPFFRMSRLLLVHLVAVHGLWYAPIFAWLLLVSAAVRRVPFVWAALPVVAFVIVERIAFGTSNFGAMLGARMSGGAEGSAFMKPMAAIHAQHSPLAFLGEPGLWAGLAVATLFLAGAVRFRRDHGPS